MVESLPIVKSYKRLGAFPLDEDTVFTDLTKMESYIAGGSSYAGQTVSLVDVSTNSVTDYKILPDKTYSSDDGTKDVLSHINESLNEDVFSIFNQSTSEFALNSSLEQQELVQSIEGSILTKEIELHSKSLYAILFTFTLVSTDETNSLYGEVYIQYDSDNEEYSLGLYAGSKNCYLDILSTISTSVLEVNKIGFKLFEDEGINGILYVNDIELDDFLWNDSEGSIDLTAYNYSFGGMYLTGKIKDSRISLNNSEILNIPNFSLDLSEQFPEGYTSNDIEIEESNILFPHSDEAIIMEDGKTLRERNNEIEEKFQNQVLHDRIHFTLSNTEALTSFVTAIQIVTIPKFLNITELKLIDLSDSSEIDLVIDSQVSSLPVSIPLGDYKYSIVYEDGATNAFLLVDFTALQTD